MKKILAQIFSPTGVLVIFFFLLPWQTRYIFGWSYLSGASTQFGILSVYATQVWLLVGVLWIYLGKNLRSWIFALPSSNPAIEVYHRRAILLSLAILLLAGLSSLWAAQSIPALAALIDLAGACLVFVALLDKRVDLKRVAMAFVLGLIIPVGLGLAQVLLGGSGASTLFGLAGRDAQALGDAVLVFDGTRVLRAYGSFPHPNIFGGYLAVGVLLAMYLATGKHRRAWFTIAGVLFLGLILTASRSALLGLLLGGTTIVLSGYILPLGKGEVRRGHNRGTAASLTAMTIAVTVIVLALGAELLAPSLVSSLRGGGVTEARSLSERADQYREWSSTMHGADWLIGNGPRNYVFALADVHPDRGVWEYQPIHNVPFLLLSELGLIGLILVGMWIVELYRQNVARWPDRETIYAFGCGAVLFVIIFFDHYLWSSWNGLVLVVYVGALLIRLGDDKSMHMPSLSLN